LQCAGAAALAATLVAATCAISFDLNWPSVSHALRGSWSDFVGAWELFHYGGATKTTETCSVAGRPHDREKRLAAKEALKFPPVNFSGIQARAIGRGFAAYAAKSSLTIHACAILPDHVHLVLARHLLDVEKLLTAAQPMSRESQAQRQPGLVNERG